ncbi:MAG: hypothetical protein ABIS36_12055 [Chryseolinea sp.]
MNNSIRYIFACFVACISCVDDYTDSNPPHQLDAPFLRISSDGNNQQLVSVPVNAYQNTYRSYAQYGGPVQFTVSVVDAPGLVGTVSVVPSVPDFGTVTLDDASVTALAGKDKGDFRFTFTSNPAIPDQSDRSMNLVITVSDSQLNHSGEPDVMTTIITVPTILVACVSDAVKDGVYVVTAASGNLDGGDPYTLDDLKTDGEVDEITVELATERPGLVTIDDATAGVWPVYYSGRLTPVIKLDVCGQTIKGHEGETSVGEDPGPVRDFTVDAVLNADGTITVTWSYARINGTTPDTPAKGTYTLSKQ